MLCSCLLKSYIVVQPNHFGVDMSRRTTKNSTTRLLLRSSLAIVFKCLIFWFCFGFQYIKNELEKKYPLLLTPQEQSDTFTLHDPGDVWRLQERVLSLVGIKEHFNFRRGKSFPTDIPQIGVTVKQPVLVPRDVGVSLLNQALQTGRVSLAGRETASSLLVAEDIGEKAILLKKAAASFSKVLDQVPSDTRSAELWAECVVSASLFSHSLHSLPTSSLVACMSSESSSDSPAVLFCHCRGYHNRCHTKAGNSPPAWSWSNCQPTKCGACPSCFCEKQLSQQKQESARVCAAPSLSGQASGQAWDFLKERTANSPRKVIFHAAVAASHPCLCWCQHELHYSTPKRTRVFSRSPFLLIFSHHPCCSPIGIGSAEIKEGPIGGKAPTAVGITFASATELGQGLGYGLGIVGCYFAGVKRVEASCH